MKSRRDSGLEIILRSPQHATPYRSRATVGRVSGHMDKSADPITRFKMEFDTNPIAMSRVHSTHSAILQRRKSHVSQRWLGWCGSDEPTPVSQSHVSKSLTPTTCPIRHWTDRRQYRGDSLSLDQIFPIGELYICETAGPVPAGANYSAPLLDSCDDRQQSLIFRCVEQRRSPTATTHRRAVRRAEAACPEHRVVDARPASRRHPGQLRRLSYAAA